MSDENESKNYRGCDKRNHNLFLLSARHASHRGSNSKMIPLENFFDDVRNHNIITKAKSEKLWIRKLRFRAYRVLNRKKYANKKRTVRHGIYDVSFFEDRDGQRFGHCTCPAGNPKLDDNGIPLYEPRACYHLAAVYAHHLKVARKAKERELLKNKTEIKKPVLVLCSFVNVRAGATAQA